MEEDYGCVCCGAEITDTGTNGWYYCEYCTSERCACGVCVNCCECGEDDDL